MDAERKDDHEAQEVLCRRVKAGDTLSFVSLIHLYQKKIFLLALSILRDREDALDVVQETFMRVYQKIASFEEGGNFES